MPVEIIKGDMVLSYKNNELDAYAHQCNCFCRLGRGLAPLLVKANKDVRKVDNETIEGDRNKLGSFGVVKSNNFPVLYNCYSQYHWSKYKEPYGGNTDYGALKDCLSWIVLHMYDEQLTTLGLPLIGCGLAGGDWDNVVYPMIKDIFEDSNICVTVFVL